MTDTFRIPIGKQKQQLRRAGIEILPTPERVILSVTSIIFREATTECEPPITPELELRTLARSGRRSFLRLEGPTPSP
jgi:hypothetical protein